MMLLMRNLCFLFILVMAMAACQQSASSLVSVSSNLDSYSNGKLHWGDPIDIQMESGSHDSIQLYLNGERVETPIVLESHNSVLGRNGLKLMVYTDGQSTSREVSVLVLPKEAPQDVSYSIVNAFPHNPEFFTEGFYYDNGSIYEGTGLNGKSKLMAYKLETGEIEKSIDLDAKYFGEGIALVGDSVLQLSYKAKKVFVYSRTSFDKVGEFDVPFSAEGWGLSFDGQNLIMSNGSHYLYKIDPKNFTLKSFLQVASNKDVVIHLNELEYYNGKIFANVWFEKKIVIINSETGEVEKEIHLDKIPAENFQRGVANGIAIKDGNLLITGKNWTEIYEIQLEN